MEKYDLMCSSAEPENQNKTFSPIDKQAWAEK